MPGDDFTLQSPGTDERSRDQKTARIFSKSYWKKRFIGLSNDKFLQYLRREITV
jgi:hypothetical protein